MSIIQSQPGVYPSNSVSTITASRQRRPSVAFVLPEYDDDGGDERGHVNNTTIGAVGALKGRRGSSHSKNSSITSLGGYSTCSSVASSSTSASSRSHHSVASSSASATPSKGRQLRKTRRRSSADRERDAERDSLSGFSWASHATPSARRISQDSLAKDLPPLPADAQKRISGQLPLLPLLDVKGIGSLGVPDALLSPWDGTNPPQPQSQQQACRAISTYRSRSQDTIAHSGPVSAPCMPRQVSAEDARRVTEMWLEMLDEYIDEMDDAPYSPSLAASPSSGRASLDAFDFETAASSTCCDPDFLARSSPHSQPVPAARQPNPEPQPEAAKGLFSNPFEASFAKAATAPIDPDTAGASVVVAPGQRRASLPTHLSAHPRSSSSSRLDRHRPPPLELVPESPRAGEECERTATAQSYAQHRSQSLSHDLHPSYDYHNRFRRSQPSSSSTSLSPTTACTPAATLSPSASASTASSPVEMAHTPRSRENSYSSAASMTFTSSADSRRTTASQHSSSSTASSGLPNPRSPTDGRGGPALLPEMMKEESVKTLSALREGGEGGDEDTTETVRVGDQRGAQRRSQHTKQKGSNSSFEIVMYGMAM